MDLQCFGQTNSQVIFNIQCQLLFYNQQKIMPPYDYKITKAQEDLKRRPSIELSPTLEKPIYIITKNMNGSHVLALIDALEKEGIQYQLQQETSTLGFVLNQRFFVIVDNKYGEVTLGADFASLWMTIVGYPKIGKNKKNKYCERPSQVIKFFKEFKASPELKLSRSNLKYGEKDMVIDDVPSSQMRSKIEIRSIIKYKSQDSKSQVDSHNSLKEACKRQSQRIKLIILQDKTDKEYASICQALMVGQKAKECIELASNFQEVRKKTLFHTIAVKIYYLVNSKNAQDLINTIFIGQILVFSEKQSVKINQMVNEPKIYAVAYQKGQIFKILHKIGFDTVPATFFLSSNINPTSTYNDSKNSPFLLKNESNIKTIEKTVAKKEEPKQMSKIQNNVSVIQENHPSCEPSDLNASVISRASSGGRKIKKLRAKSKGKESKENSQPEQLPKAETKQEAKESQRKRTLKNNEYYQTTSRSKKNLTFKQNLIESTKIKRVKSIPKVQPEVFHMKEQNCPTMTESEEYYTLVTPAKTLTTSSVGNFFDRSQNSFSSSSKSRKINAFFYREFVPKFHNIAQLIKLKPSTIFPENDKNGYMQSFVYMKEYDRFVRRVKNQLKEKNQSIEEYNFLVLLRDEDFPLFLDYCRSKNRYYQDQECDFGSTMKESIFSCLSKTNSKINVFAFIEGESITETISCGRIEIYKHKLMDDISDYNLSKTLACLREKIQTYGLIC